MNLILPRLALHFIMAAPEQPVFWDNISLTTKGVTLLNSIQCLSTLAGGNTNCQFCILLS